MKTDREIIDPQAAIEALRENLGNIERRRALVGGEVEGQVRALQYGAVVTEAGRVYAEAIKLSERNEDPNFLVAAASAALLAAGANESNAKHGELTDEERESSLDEAVEWLERLKAIPGIDSINRTLHGPIVWQAEIARNVARTHERRTINQIEHLQTASDLYQQAVEIGRQKTEEGINTQDNELINAARSAAGVSLGEFARVQDMLHASGQAILSDNEILTRYAEGCDLVWLTLDIPNMDRVDTVLQRFFDYLVSHRVSPVHPEFQKTLRRFYELVKIEEEKNLGTLVLDRMPLRAKKYPSFFVDFA